MTSCLSPSVYSSTKQILFGRQQRPAWLSQIWPVELDEQNLILAGFATTPWPGPSRSYL